MPQAIARPHPPEHRVIQSKLIVPPLPERFAERPRLENLLAGHITSKRAVILTTPMQLSARSAGIAIR